MAPVVTLAGPVAADEGETKSYSFSVVDPGTDTFSLTTATCDGGTKTDEVFTAATGAGSFKCTFPDGPATHSVSVTVADSDGAADSNGVSVSVSNVAPTVTFTGGDQSVAEGQSRTYSYSIGDPGADSVQSVTPSCGTGGQLVSGSASNTDTAGSFDCLFPDGPASPSVTVQATDSDGAAGNTDSRAVEVNNVAPVVELAGADSADEGDTKTYTYTVSDAGGDSTTVVESCGVNGTRTDTAAADSFDCTFPDGPASSTVSVTADDGDPTNNTGSDDIVVSVSNVAPTVLLLGLGTADEGDVNTYGFTVSDPGMDAITVDTNCGTAGTKVSGTESYDEAEGTGSFDCRFPDGPATSGVTASATDSDGASNIDQQNVLVDVSNVAPVVTLAGPDAADEGETKSYSFSVVDPGTDTFSLSTATCDGGTKTDEVFSAATGAGSFKCTFPDGPATHSVSVTVADSDGAADSDVVSVEVSNVAPVVELAGADSADEGQTKTYTYTVSDAGGDSTTVVESCGAQRDPDRHGRGGQLRLHVPRRAGVLDGLGDRR